MLCWKDARDRVTLYSLDLETSNPARRVNDKIVMMRFNATKFCYLAGHSAGLTNTYRLTLLFLFVSFDILVITINSVALVGIMQNFKQFFVKGKVFVVTLILIDFLCGSTFLTLFVFELSEERDFVDCRLSSWRVIFFIYCLSTRILCMFFISLQSYIKTCRQTTTLEYRFDKHTTAINIICVWMPGIVAIVTVASSHIKTDKILGSILFVYFVFLIMCSIACYAMVLKSVKSAKRRNNANIYNTALYYIKMILIWFLITNIPLAICGFVLLVYAFFPEQRKRDQDIVQPIYLVCLGITALNVTINPIFFIQKFENVRKSLSCSSRSLQDLYVHSHKRSAEDVKSANQVIHAGIKAYCDNDYVWCWVPIKKFGKVQLS